MSSVKITFSRGALEKKLKGLGAGVVTETESAKRNEADNKQAALDLSEKKEYFCSRYFYFIRILGVLMFMEKRPKLKIPFTPLDKLLEILSLIGLVSIIAYSIYIYNKLPDKIPGHFDFAGNVTNYTGKGGLIALPLVSLFMYIPLTLLEKVPHIYNYIVSITEANAYTQYSIGRRMIISLKAIMILT